MSTQANAETTAATGAGQGAALLATTYFGPVQWYQKLARHGTALIEAHENFQKQTFRNRCVIATTAGTQTLTVPVEHLGGGGKVQMRDIRVSDHGNWRHLHWHALLSAYSETPFFDYYADDLRPFFERKWTFLLDFNEAIRATVCSLLDIHPRVALTAACAPLGATEASADGDEAPWRVCDYRMAIDPKHPQEDADFCPRPYYQVFAAKNGFIPNLSILDLLFNMGPEAIFWLVR